MSPTQQEIEDARTPKGGWTKKTLAEWGIPWPPTKGWRQRLIRESERARPNDEDRASKELSSGRQDF